jgi:hypothetical protein
MIQIRHRADLPGFDIIKDMDGNIINAFRKVTHSIWIFLCPG